MIRKEALRNKIRELGYTYKTQQKRTHLWKNPKTSHYISLPMRDLVTEEYVRFTLRDAGCEKEEIEAFIASAKS